MAHTAPKFELRASKDPDSNPEMLIIEDKLEFCMNKSNKRKTSFIYYCKFRQTKGIFCNCKLTLVKNQVEEEVRYMIKPFSNIHNHQGCMPEIVAEKIKLEMCELVRKQPEEPVSVAGTNVLLKYSELYQSQPELWKEIIECVGEYSALDKRLYRARQKVVGKAPNNRNMFDPLNFLSEDDEMIIMDSQNLPASWKRDVEKKVNERNQRVGENSMNWSNVN